MPRAGLDRVEEHRLGRVSLIAGVQGKHRGEGELRGAGEIEVPRPVVGGADDGAVCLRHTRGEGVLKAGELRLIAVLAEAPAEGGVELLVLPAEEGVRVGRVVVNRERQLHGVPETGRSYARTRACPLPAGADSPSH